MVAGVANSLATSYQTWKLQACSINQGSSELGCLGLPQELASLSPTKSLQGPVSALRLCRAADGPQLGVKGLALVLALPPTPKSGWSP